MRYRDGTPVSIETGNPESVWQIRSTSAPKHTESFNPRLETQPLVGTVIEVGKKYFEVTESMKGQDKPDSVYANLIQRPANLEELREQGKLVVVSP